eukprot:TRINITY_DN26270_c0_g1_i1.p1 TRINITY_DN26270_c0_g1~~TRINITY_DN26270_c0_g1_i1.p1  ORF type:complete len:959 (+),score=95.72 TRINITY_DN26270_c0_g1_i1:107-2983(+)
MSISDRLSKVLHLHGYCYDDKVGEGAFGKVLRVRRCTASEYRLCVKVLDLVRASTSEKGDAYRECMVLSSLEHPFIVQHRESFLENGCLCIVMDYCDGGDVDKKIKEAKKIGRLFEEARVVHWLAQAFLALRYLHKQHILHRDMKPHNWFLEQQSDVLKVGDFGLSKVLECTDALARSWAGTPDFVSPEMCRGEPYAWPSDLWAMGISLFELCTLGPPFHSSGGLHGIVKLITSLKVPPVLPGNHSCELKRLAHDLLQPDAEKRPNATQCLDRPLLSSVAETLQPCQPVSSDVRMDLTALNAGFMRRRSSANNSTNSSADGTRVLEVSELALASNGFRAEAKRPLQLVTPRKPSKDKIQKERCTSAEKKVGELNHRAENAGKIAVRADPMRPLLLGSPRRPNPENVPSDDKSSADGQLRDREVNRCKPAPSTSVAADSHRLDVMRPIQLSTPRQQTCSDTSSTLVAQLFEGEPQKGKPSTLSAGVADVYTNAVSKLPGRLDPVRPVQLAPARRHSQEKSSRQLGATIEDTLISVASSNADHVQVKQPGGGALASPRPFEAQNRTMASPRGVTQSSAAEGSHDILRPKTSCPIDVLTYSKGDVVDYFCQSRDKWLRTRVSAVGSGEHQRGCIMVDLKPNVWISAEVQARCVRLAKACEAGSEAAPCLDSVMELRPKTTPSKQLPRLERLSPREDRPGAHLPQRSASKAHAAASSPWSYLWPPRPQSRECREAAASEGAPPAANAVRRAEVVQVTSCTASPACDAGASGAAAAACASGSALAFGGAGRPSTSGGGGGAGGAVPGGAGGESCSNSTAKRFVRSASPVIRPQTSSAPLGPAVHLTGATGTFAVRRGDAVDYREDAERDWAAAQVLDVDPRNQAIQLDVQPGVWLSIASGALADRLRRRRPASPPAATRRWRAPQRWTPPTLLATSSPRMQPRPPPVPAMVAAPPLSLEPEPL